MSLSPIPTISPAKLAQLNGVSTPTAPGNATAAAGTASASGGSAGSGLQSAASLQNEFLTMFTAQLKNQDPLNPMDSSQMTAQLAQISTVSGIQQLNSTLTAMMGGSTAVQTAQAAGLIGHSITAPGSQFALGANGSPALGVRLDSAADTVNVSITDAAGATVRSLKLGAQQAGALSFTWDGRSDAGVAVPPGQYGISTQASVGGKAVGSSALVTGSVTGVSSSASGVSLQVSGVGNVALTSVSQIH